MNIRQTHRIYTIVSTKDQQCWLSGKGKLDGQKTKRLERSIPSVAVTWHRRHRGLHLFSSDQYHRLSNDGIGCGCRWTLDCRANRQYFDEILDRQFHRLPKQEIGDYLHLPVKGWIHRAYSDGPQYFRYLYHSRFLEHREILFRPFLRDLHHDAGANREAETIQLDSLVYVFRCVHYRPVNRRPTNSQQHGRGDLVDQCFILCPVRVIGRTAAEIRRYRPCLPPIADRFPSD